MDVMVYVFGLNKMQHKFGLILSCSVFEISVSSVSSVFLLSVCRGRPCAGEGEGLKSKKQLTRIEKGQAQI